MKEFFEPEFEIHWNGWQYQVSKDRLYVLREGKICVQACLAPLAEDRQSMINSWSKIDNGAYKADLDIGGAVFLQVREANLAYWMETDVDEYDNIIYFPHMTFDGDRWQSYVSDGYDKLWDKYVDVEVPVSSAYDDLMHPDIADGAGLTDPGDRPPMFVWNMPSRALTFDTTGGWLGVAVPGVLPVGVTRLKMHKAAFSLGFEVIRPACSKGVMPVVYFVTGLNGPYDVIDEEKAISDRLGLMTKKSSEHPSWWSAPGFKAYIEQWRLAQEKGNAGEKVDYLSLMTQETLTDWIYTVKNDLRLTEMFAILEQGAYRLYGDYRPTDSMGGLEGFREMVDQLREDDIRMCFYIHPFMCNTKIDFYRQHPEAFCRSKKTGHKTYYALDFGDAEPEFALIDWTHPKAREYILDQVEMILSDKPGCMNCDWLRSNHWRSPDPRIYDFHDPDWGIGDMMTMKVQKMLYEKTKSIKPHACVSKAGLGASYMQPYADVVLLSEEWNGCTDNWYKRGRLVTRMQKDMLYITDPYFLTITKSYEYYMAMAVWVIMEDPIVKHAIHPYTHFRELADKDYRRRRAGVQTQLNAPLNITDKCHVEPNENDVCIWRKRTTGPLAGWYASRAFGKRCFVTYSETEARIASSQTRTIDMPLPPGADIQKVEIVPHEGKPRKWDFVKVQTSDGPGLRIYVEDSGVEAMYYRVKYSL